MQLCELARNSSVSPPGQNRPFPFGRSIDLDLNGGLSSHHALRRFWIMFRHWKSHLYRIAEFK
jgi:hypothetical protein